LPKFWIGSREYRTKGAAQEAVRDVLYGYSVGSVVDKEEDHLLLLDLLDLHEEADVKIGVGVESFVIAPPPQGTVPGFRSDPHRRHPHRLLLPGLSEAPELPPAGV
jgi:hypothetical protein